MSPQDFAERVNSAAADGLALRIRGGGSKDFYGLAARGELLDTRTYGGIAEYEPTELVVTARAGTPLAELEAALAAHGQMLPFELPHFGGAATLGGAVACGLSGPRRAANNGYYGAVRDYVLGVKMVDGKGEILSFGGQVMKNVAGYDVSRMMAGAMGTLGLILEVSLKVLPKPVATRTLQLSMRDPAAVIRTLNEWGGKPLPITATTWSDGDLRVRLEGARAAVDSASRQIGGSGVDEAQADGFWRGVRDQSDAFFSGAAPLWRISVPSTAMPLGLAGREFIEWGGALRWLASDAPAAEVRKAALRAGGHATLFRAADELKRAAGVFAPLDPVLARVHKKLKAAFDPTGVFNPGRMYPDF